ncbi:hypothetical protein LVY65_10020 [Sphingomonas sp. G124]|uniref:Uncharacterized protein n=1 Tax=Sphingomonas cremea TaxID=2904799 RepID=A0A9X1QNJ7_9SPHN|nr:hypothetical protein [Sphingomonas cremea]MCF2515397.1 hypothetical protein [Sphingomonas cremea]
MPFLLLGLAIIALIPAVFIVDGLIEGEVQAKGGSYRRAEDPGRFWAMIGMYAAMIAGLAYMAVDVVLSEPI